MAHRNSMQTLAVPLPAALCRLGVTLWRVALDGEERVAGAAAAALLGPLERQRWQAYRSPQAAAAFLQMRLSLLRLLRAHFGIDIAGCSLAYGRQGKPALPAGGPPWFNLSHAAACGCIALSARGEVGVDIEPLAPLPTPVPAGVFTARERACIQRSGARGFYRLWTRKEALLKALGLGFAADPAAYCVAGAVGAAGEADPQGLRCGAARLWSIDTIAGHGAALACIDEPQG